LGSTIAFLEGEHDAIFFQQFVETYNKVPVTTSRPREAIKFVRRLSPGIMLLDCQGATHLFPAAKILMRQMINIGRSPYRELLMIADSDVNLSVNELAREIDNYVHAHCKTHTLSFNVGCDGNKVTLTEPSKERSLSVQLHLVPDSLEAQILEAMQTKKGLKLPSTLGPERARLLSGCAQLGYSDFEDLLRDSVKWFEETKWSRDIRDKLDKIL